MHYHLVSKYYTGKLYCELIASIAPMFSIYYKFRLTHTTLTWFISTTAILHGQNSQWLVFSSGYLQTDAAALLHTPCSQ